MLEKEDTEAIAYISEPFVDNFCFSWENEFL